MAPLIATVAWRYRGMDGGELSVTPGIVGITEKQQWLVDNLASSELRGITHILGVALFT